jgi:hypothetical protein
MAVQLPHAILVTPPHGHKKTGHFYLLSISADNGRHATPDHCSPLQLLDVQIAKSQFQVLQTTAGELG